MTAASRGPPHHRLPGRGNQPHRRHQRRGHAVFPGAPAAAWWWSGTAWAEGIRDGVLKELANNIKVFDLGDSEADTLVSSVIEDFVRDYWTVSLPTVRRHAWPVFPQHRNPR